MLERIKNFFAFLYGKFQTSWLWTAFISLGLSGLSMTITAFLAIAIKNPVVSLIRIFLFFGFLIFPSLLKLANKFFAQMKVNNTFEKTIIFLVSVLITANLITFVSPISVTLVEFMKETNVENTLRIIGMIFSLLFESLAVLTVTWTLIKNIKNMVNAGRIFLNREEVELMLSQELAPQPVNASGISWGAPTTYTSVTANVFSDHPFPEVYVDEKEDKKEEKKAVAIDNDEFLSEELFGHQC